MNCKSVTILLLGILDIKMLNSQAALCDPKWDSIVKLQDRYQARVLCKSHPSLSKIITFERRGEKDVLNGPYRILKNDTVLEDGYYEDGRPNESSTTYFKDGKIKTLIQFYDTVTFEFTFHSNGNIKSYGKRTRGVWDGRWQTFYENGSLMGISEYKVVYLTEEEIKDNFRKGRINWIVGNKMAVAHGTWIKYNPEGQVIELNEYKLGKRITNNSPVVVKEKRYKGFIFEKDSFVTIPETYQKNRYTPTRADVATAEVLLKEKLPSINKERINQTGTCPVIHKKLKRYNRQYLGYINENGEKVIWINFIWDKHKPQSDLLKDIVRTQNGCSYYWNIKINLATGMLSDLSINGN